MYEVYIRRANCEPNVSHTTLRVFSIHSLCGAYGMLYFSIFVITAVPQALSRSFHLRSEVNSLTKSYEIDGIPIRSPVSFPL
ncbi:unnamed protein product [Rhizophagus irregularis]|nr:unnamed protein product [Rhizophagus irregularis]